MEGIQPSDYHNYILLQIYNNLDNQAYNWIEYHRSEHKVTKTIFNYSVHPESKHTYNSALEYDSDWATGIRPNPHTTAQTSITVRQTVVHDDAEQAPRMEGQVDRVERCLSKTLQMAVRRIKITEPALDGLKERGYDVDVGEVKNSSGKHHENTVASRTTSLALTWTVTRNRLGMLSLTSGMSVIST
jgi:hypothetical protein